ncbi:hypothetical protein BASA62_007804 [Batrachochytrium salamandrivorans]|nr:hypothetical protein BASA62_007804 [Batrachochytrium salamandrivorans]
MPSPSHHSDGVNAMSTRLSNVVIDDSEHEVQGNSSATRFPATSAAPFVPLMTHGPIAAPLISLQGTDPISSEDVSVARSWPDSTQSIGVNDDTGSEVSLRGLPEACLFVASLAAVRSDTELQESVTTHFKAWGELMNVRVIKDWMGRPYAFVQFKVVEDAQRALVEANNTIIDGRHIRIEQAKVNRTLFVSKINSTLTESEVLEIAAQHGPIESLTVASSSTTNTETSGSTAHIKYRYREDAVDAFAAFRASELWSVDWASNVIDKASRDVDPFCIFVGNLNPVLVTEDLLRERFSVYGEINFINLIVRNIESPTARPAFALVRYTTVSAAAEGVVKENGQVWLDLPIRVQLWEIYDGPSPALAYPTPLPSSSNSSSSSGSGVAMRYLLKRNAAGLLRNVQHRHPRHHLLPPILGPAKGPQSFQGEVVSVVPADHLQLQYNYPPYGYNGLMMPPPHMTNYQGYGIMPYPQQGLLAASAPPPFLMLPGNWDPATGQTRMVECPGSTPQQQQQQQYMQHAYVYPTQSSDHLQPGMEQPWAAEPDNSISTEAEGSTTELDPSVMLKQGSVNQKKSST